MLPVPFACVRTDIRSRIHDCTAHTKTLSYRICTNIFFSDKFLHKQKAFETNFQGGADGYIQTKIENRKLWKDGKAVEECD